MELCERFGESRPTPMVRSRIGTALRSLGLTPSKPLHELTWVEPVVITRRRRAVPTPPPGARQHWLLVASRQSTQGINSKLGGGQTVDWTVSRELRAGDLALLFERGKPERPDSTPGRKEIVAILHALTDAEEDYWYEDLAWWAELDGVPVYPRIDIGQLRDEPRLESWPALKASVRGRAHKVGEPHWGVLLDSSIGRIRVQARMHALGVSLDPVQRSGTVPGSLPRRSPIPPGVGGGSESRS